MGGCRPECPRRRCVVVVSADIEKLVKAAVAAKVAELTKHHEDLLADLERMRSRPVPGGPFLLADLGPNAGQAGVVIAKQAPAPKLAEAQRLRLIADQCGDPGIASAYRAKAKQVEQGG